jgi:ABC-type lipoprotein export system ATPase subunit
MEDRMKKFNRALEGSNKRVAIARALSNPSLILCDEPTAAEAAHENAQVVTDCNLSRYIP